MNKLIIIFRKIYYLLKAYKELGVKPIIWLRFTRLYFKKKISLQEYLNYKTSLSNPTFRDTFLSYGEAENYWALLNPNKYSALARDKYITHLLLEKCNIPMPKLFVYYNAEAGDCYENVREKLVDNNVQQCVIKPAADSAHGDGVFVCKEIRFLQDDCEIIKSNGEILSLKDFCESNRTTPMLFEGKIEQTNQLSLINSSSANTVRFMTALYPNGIVKVFATWMKFGRAGSDIDNAGGGGNVGCGVNIETGECFNVTRFDSFKNSVKIEKHPDSGININGMHIQKWGEIKKRICEYQAKIPQLKAIGWDVALTDDGPVIIEINNWWDTTGQLFIGKGWREEVVDCYNAWKNHYNQRGK